MIRTPSLLYVSGDLSIWHSSLIPMSEALVSTSQLPDILLNFSHFNDDRRLTLAQNPHFYDGPTFPIAFGPAFETRPTDNYQGTICVLTKNERRVYLEHGQNWRAFDNFWMTNNHLLFKGSCPAFFLAVTDKTYPDFVGKFEGEDVVGNRIPPPPPPHVWSFVVYPELRLELVGVVEDWRDPIRVLLDDPRTCIHIKANGH
jgi:hypothetical protein